MKKITYEDWVSEGERLFGKNKLEWKFICPQCKTVQSGADFLELTKLTIEEIPKYVGFSCIGRFTKKKGCDWTLGGLFQIHELEIIQEGKTNRFFEFAQPILEIKEKLK